MKTFLLFLLVLAACCFGQTSGGRPYVRYAQFKEGTEVEASDGSRWAMDAGDCFPIYMFKDQQKRVVLQLGSVTFGTDTVRVQVLPESEEARARASYERTLANFTASQARRKDKQ